MLDTVTRPAATSAPRRCWTDDEDVDAAMLYGIGTSDDEIGRRLGRSAKAVHHRRMRLTMLAAAKAAPAPAPVPAGSDLDLAERRYLDAQAACDAAHDAYNAAMQPYLAPVAEALRRAGVVTDTDTSGDCDEGEAAWRVVEALRRAGVELRVPF